MSSQVQIIKTKEDLRIANLAGGEIHRFLIQLSDNALGVPWRVPVIVIRGKKSGPNLGVTAAVHGNELNGISTIFKLIDVIDPRKLSGNLIMVPICNVPGYLANQRLFTDNVDLNRIMPGKPKGSTSDVYAHYLVKKIVKKFDLLLDLHTASHGRINSLYLRADLENQECLRLASLQNPQIIVKKFDEQGTLRGWANENGIPAITIEIGNANAFQQQLVDETLEGILNTMRHYKMISGKAINMVQEATVCENSYWIRAERGGIVEVLPSLTEIINEGDVIANIYDVFGRIKQEIRSDRSGIVIGKNVRPNCNAGTRLLHLGVNFGEKLTLA